MMGSASSRWLRPMAALSLAAGGYAELQWLGRTYGSTHRERAVPMPGDDIVADPQLTATHAITINAPATEVWPWLVQMGWHRAGWYTARWVDRLLFRANRPSVHRIVPELQGLAVGDFVPDGPPESECGFVVERLDPDRTLLLHSTSHLPLQWRRGGIAGIDWTWEFVLEALDGGRRTRFVFRWRARVWPWWLVAGCWVAVIPADFVMSRDMLRGVKARAECTELTSAVMEARSGP